MGIILDTSHQSQCPDHKPLNTSISLHLYSHSAPSLTCKSFLILLPTTNFPLTIYSPQKSQLHDLYQKMFLLLDFPSVAFDSGPSHAPLGPWLSFSLPTLRLFHGKGLCRNCFLHVGSLPLPPLHLSSSFRPVSNSLLKGCCPWPSRTGLGPSTLYLHCRLPFPHFAALFTLFRQCWMFLLVVS